MFFEVNGTQVKLQDLLQPRFLRRISSNTERPLFAELSGYLANTQSTTLWFDNQKNLLHFFLQHPTFNHITRRVGEGAEFAALVCPRWEGFVLISSRRRDVVGLLNLGKLLGTDCGAEPEKLKDLVEADLHLDRLKVLCANEAPETYERVLKCLRRLSLTTPDEEQVLLETVTDLVFQGVGETRIYVDRQFAEVRTGPETIADFSGRGSRFPAKAYKQLISSPSKYIEVAQNSGRKRVYILRFGSLFKDYEPRQHNPFIENFMNN